MKNDFKKYFFLSLLLLMPSFALHAEQMPPQTSPHEMPGVANTGEIAGVLFTQNEKGTKTPLTQQQVSLIVFNNNQQVLMLEKTTDQNGHFHFKNIFRDPAFSYGLGLSYNNDLFVYPRFQLDKNEAIKKIEFQVGTGSPYQRNLESMMKQRPAATLDRDSFTNWQKFFQGFAILLLVLTVIFSAYFLGKRAKK